MEKRRSLENAQFEHPNRIGFKDGLGYAMGDAGNLFILTYVSSYLKVFYTDVELRITVLFLIARLWDAINDPLWGGLIAKKKPTKDGKFRPFIKWFAIPLGISAMLCYVNFTNFTSNQNLILALAYITYIGFGMMYTTINIPYGSMASVMSSEADDRAALSTFRGLGSLIPQIIIGVVMPMFLYTKLEDGSQVVNASAFPVLAAILAVASAACYIIWGFICTERVPVTEKQENISFKDTVKALFSNRALIGIVIVYVCFLGAQMMNQSISNYIFKDYFKNTMGLTVMNAAGFAPALILAPLAVPLSSKIGKKEVGIVASIMGTIAFAAFVMFSSVFEEPDG